MVMTAWPVGSRPISSTMRLHSSRMAGPPARWIAPSTPPPPISPELAALTIASTSSSVMSPFANRRLVSDLVGGKSVLVIGTAKGPAAAAYYSSVDGRPLTFRLGEDSIEDLETGSVWDFSGLALSGPLKGTRLAPVPSRTGFWFLAGRGAAWHRAVRTGVTPARPSASPRVGKRGARG